MRAHTASQGHGRPNAVRHKAPHYPPEVQARLARERAERMNRYAREWQARMDGYYARLAASQSLAPTVGPPTRALSGSTRTIIGLGIVVFVGVGMYYSPVIFIGVLWLVWAVFVFGSPTTGDPRVND